MKSYVYKDSDVIVNKADIKEKTSWMNLRIECQI